jgi:hypothetical protein
MPDRLDCTCKRHSANRHVAPDQILIGNVARLDGHPAGDMHISLIGQRTWIMWDDRSPAVAHVAPITRYKNVAEGAVK